MTAEQWRTIYFLAIRGASSEYENELRQSTRRAEELLRKGDELAGRPPRPFSHRHEAHCFSDFVTVMAQFKEAITPAFPEVERPQETLPPHPTSPTAE